MLILVMGGGLFRHSNNNGKKLRLFQWIISIGRPWLTRWLYPLIHYGLLVHCIMNSWTTLDRDWSKSFQALSLLPPVFIIRLSYIVRLANISIYWVDKFCSCLKKFMTSIFPHWCLKGSHMMIEHCLIPSCVAGSQTANQQWLARPLSLKRSSLPA